ncbi:helix-turn-helix domain-containing protein [Seohaeicola nanhaiensis]|uniref:Helix-turn-helix domain-containing protein n=1 Tax=Seohaeicola nanhaiensis TaxID=1387282 RepID=A0ABV9KCA8_9RHOB
MARRVNARRVKVHRTYTLAELADILGVTIGTVRRWCKDGLPCFKDARPFIVRGCDFKQFHADRLARKTTKLKPLEVFCLGCKAPRQPQAGLVDFEHMDTSRVRIMAICPTCEGMARRIIGRQDLRKWGVKFGFATNMQEHA